MKSKRIQKILITGGLGQEGFYEGDKMRDFLWQNGVPLSDLIVDNMGSNTLLSVKNTLKLKASLKFQSIIVVSQYYHILRIKLLFRQLGFNRVSSVSPYYFEARDIYSLLREFLAYYRHRFSPPVK